MTCHTIFPVPFPFGAASREELDLVPFYLRLGRLRRLTALRVLRNGSAPRPRLATFLANLNALVNGPLRELRPTALTPLLAARRTGAVLRLAALLPLRATRFAVLFMRFLSFLKSAMLLFLPNHRNPYRFLFRPHNLLVCP